MQGADRAISSVGDQALQEAKQLASTTAEAGKWSTLIAKAQKDKVTAVKKWVTLKS